MYDINIKRVKALLAFVLLSLFLFLGYKFEYRSERINAFSGLNVRTVDSRSHPLLVMPNTSSNFQANVTVVTAYFNIGTFIKGNIGNNFTPSMYYNWARIFRYLQNPLVVYTDSEASRNLFINIRNNSLDKTKIFVIDRSTSWAFQNRDKIKQIFDSPAYPKFYPNTVVPEYACAQHAKYDVTARAAKEDIFKTKYYMWLDIGYFRNRKSNAPFLLTKPNNFNESRIAMNLVYTNHPLTALPADIMKRNLVRVGGGLFFGTKDIIIAFAADFKRAVEYYLKKGWMNTDQQVIYAMFSNEGRQFNSPTIDLQMYKSPHEYDWFFLGSSMVRDV